MRKIVVTRHAKERIAERLNIQGKREVKELVSMAYKKGICARKNFIPKATFNWINRTITPQRAMLRNQEWRIYQGYLFLFTSTMTLLTVYKMPPHLVPRETLLRTYG